MSDTDAGVIKMSDPAQEKPADSQVPTAKSETQIQPIYYWVFAGLAVLAIAFVVYEKFWKKVNEQ